MIDLKFQTPATEPVEVCPETLAAIDRGIQDADQDRTVSIDEVRQLIPHPQSAAFGSMLSLVKWRKLFKLLGVLLGAFLYWIR